MAPIHDTDVAAERWAQEEWENYELWEKVEVRLKRQKRLWILLTVCVFMILSALPIVLDRWPKWSGRVVLRYLIQEMSQLKREAGERRVALRLRFTDSNQLTYQVEKVPDCEFSGTGEVMRTGTLVADLSSGNYRLVGPQLGEQLGIPGLQEEFCYDPLSGFGAARSGKEVVGFAVILAKDLSQRRFDRVSTVLLSGASAEVSIDE